AVTKADVEQYDLANGKTVYDANCASCHAAGIMGAPKTGTARKWNSRLPQGLATMIEKSVAGYEGEYRGSKTFMPAKGGNPDLTDKQVGDAVAYMVNEVL
uniref:Cytochrome c-555 n=2 Tax=Prosthecochloris TaxID=1101 RepID=C555_PROAE|nr:RecName: Full=Cytochrome c-555; AltName: Full=Cytochrome c555 [Prosthecochloris aestuarii]